MLKELVDWFKKLIHSAYVNDWKFKTFRDYVHTQVANGGSLPMPDAEAEEKYRQMHQAGYVVSWTLTVFIVLTSLSVSIGPLLMCRRRKACLTLRLWMMTVKMSTMTMKTMRMSTQTAIEAHRQLFSWNVCKMDLGLFAKWIWGYLHNGFGSIVFFTNVLA